MRILITGGAGFIGSHLSEHMLALGHEVVVIDDLSTGRLQNIAGLRDRPEFTFHRNTIFNRELMATLVRESDAIYHLAAAVGVKRIIEYPVQTLETNVAGAEIVLNLAASHNKRIVITSTSEVYGKSTKFPFSETDDIVLGPTTNSRWGYACSKAIDEFLALAYLREMGLPVTIARLFNTVGPGQSGQYGMVLPTFVRQALNGSPVTVFGTGNQTRCFGHVLDIVAGLASFLTTDATIGEIYNLGNIEEVSINTLAARVIAAAGSDSSVIHIPYSEAYAPGFEDMHRRVPDITKARRDIKFNPIHSLDQIIEDVICEQRPLVLKPGVIIDARAV